VSSKTLAMRLLVVAYFASGAVGLLDEVIFFKYLSLTFGATAYASSAVLVAFMGGLAGGAALAARWDSSGSPGNWWEIDLCSAITCACCVAAFANIGSRCN